MKKYLVKNAFYLNGIVQGAGNVVELDEDEFERLSTKDVIGKELKETKPSEDDVDGIKHVGGGYYELPNGEKVKGKDNALEILKAGDPDAKTEAGDTFSIGTGDAGSDQETTEV